MANQATLQLILELRDKASKELAQISGKLADLQRDAADARISLDRAFGSIDTTRLTAGLNEAREAAERLNRQPGPDATGADGMIGKLKNLAAGYATLQGAQALIDWTRQGAKIQGVADAFDRLTAASGTTAQKLLSDMRAASNGTIADAALMQTANKALLTGGDQLAQKLPQFLKIAGAASRATGQDMAQMFNDLVEGVIKAEPEILNNLGLTLNLTTVYSDYAKSIGKTADDLTQAEKSQALMNDVLELGEEYVTKLGDASDSTATKIERMAAKWEDFKNKTKGWLADRLNELEQGATAVFNPEQLDAKAAGIALQAGASYEKYREIMKRVEIDTGLLTESQYAAAQAAVKNGVSAEQAAAQQQTFAGRIAATADALAAYREKSLHAYDSLEEIRASRDAFGQLREQIDVSKDALSRFKDAFTITGDKAERIKEAQKALEDLASKGPAALSKLSQLQKDFNTDIEKIDSEHLKQLKTLHDTAAKDLKKLYEDKGKAITKLQDQDQKEREKLLDTHTRTLASIDTDALDRARGLVDDHNAKVRQLEREGQTDLEQLRKDHQQKLKDIDLAGADQRLKLIADNQKSIDSIMAQAADKQSSLLENHQDKIDDLVSQAAEKREGIDKEHHDKLIELYAQLNAAQDWEQTHAAHARIDEENRAHQEELALLDAATQKQLDKENAAYTKQEARLKEETDKRLAAQKAAFEAEQREHEAALQKQITLEKEGWKEREKAQHEGVQARIAAEVVGLEKQLTENETARQKQRDQEKADYDLRVQDVKDRTAAAIKAEEEGYSESYKIRVEAYDEQRKLEEEQAKLRREGRQEQYDAARTAEQQHLGELLQMQALALAESNRLNREQLPEILASIAEQYGLEEDHAAAHWERMTNFAGGSLDAVAQKVANMPKVADIDINVRMRIEQLAADVAGMIGAGLPLGPARATGGNVWPGTAFRVGEHGSELFVPQVAGQIIPNNSMSNINTSSVIEEHHHWQIDARGSQMTEAQFKAAVKAAIDESARTGMTRRKERGGD